MENSKKAFTLVELMVSILLLLIGIVGIISILPLAFNIQRNSKDVIMSEILARNASAMLIARPIKYSDIVASMSEADFDVFQPMNPINYGGSNGPKDSNTGDWYETIRSDNKASNVSNSLLYADTARMAFPLPNGRINNYAALQSERDANRNPESKKIYIQQLEKHYGRTFKEMRTDLRNDLMTAYGLDPSNTDHVKFVEQMTKALTADDRKNQFPPSPDRPNKLRWGDIRLKETVTNKYWHINTEDAFKRAKTGKGGFQWPDLYEKMPEQRYASGGRNDSDERIADFKDATGSNKQNQIVDLSRHLWAYNKSVNMMATHNPEDGPAPEFLWTIRDRSFPSLSKSKIAEREYFWVPLLYDADPRPGRFEWRAYVIVMVKYPGHNYKYQGVVHPFFNSSIQGFAANPRDPETVPRATLIPMKTAASSVFGSPVREYKGSKYQPLNYVYYPDYPDKSSTATYQAIISKGKLSNIDKWETLPDDRSGHQGYAASKLIPGDIFDMRTTQPLMSHSGDFQSSGWVLAGGTPTHLVRSKLQGLTDGVQHPIPIESVHYDPRKSSFNVWTWMSHNNGTGRVSVGRVIPVSGQVVRE